MRPMSDRHGIVTISWKRRGSEIPVRTMELLAICAVVVLAVAVLRRNLLLYIRRYGNTVGIVVAGPAA